MAVGFLCAVNFAAVVYVPRVYAVLLFQRVHTRLAAAEIFALEDQFLLPRIACRSQGVAEIDAEKPRVACERTLGEVLGMAGLVFMVITCFSLVLVLLPVPVLVLMRGAGAAMGFAVQHIGPEPQRRVEADIAADARIGGPGFAAGLGAAEGRVAAAEEAAADLAVNVARNHDRKLGAVIVVGPVQKRPVGKRPVAEIVGVGVLLVQVAEGPERPARLEPDPVRQARAGQGLDIGLLELDLRLAVMGAEAECQAPAELVVDIARHRYFAVAEREALFRAFGLMAELEAGKPHLLVGAVHEHGVEDDAEGRIEGVVSGPHGRLRGRGGLPVGGRRLGLHRGDLGLQRRNALFVVLLQRVDLRGQFFRRGRPRLRLGQRDGEQDRQPHGRHSHKPGNFTHRRSSDSLSSRKASPSTQSVTLYNITFLVNSGPGSGLAAAPAARKPLPRLREAGWGPASAAAEAAGGARQPSARAEGPSPDLSRPAGEGNGGRREGRNAERR